MSDEFVLPDYERFGLSNLLPSVTASINGDHGVIPLPRAKKYVVLLVDGFGWQQLRSYADDGSCTPCVSTTDSMALSLTTSELTMALPAPPSSA